MTGLNALAAFSPRTTYSVAAAEPVTWSVPLAGPVAGCIVAPPEFRSCAYFGEGRGIGGGEGVARQGRLHDERSS